MSTEPPPTYSLDPSGTSDNSAGFAEPQILIVPHSNGVGFQKGYLGADGEHAAIEGELQFKGVNSRLWGRVTMLLRTVESFEGSEVELASTEITLSSAMSSSHPTSSPSSVHPFSIPLSNDTPQCIHTPYSSIVHTLTATIYPLDASREILSHTVVVHTRRYTSHSHTLSPAPETESISDPTHVEVQVPRTTFRAGEPIPLYLTVPSPRRGLVVDEGIRLRNVRAELVRAVSVNQGAPAAQPHDINGSSSQASSSATVLKTNGTTTESLDLRSHIGAPGGVEIVAMSGASCRLHPTKELRLRLVLHPRQEDSVSEDSASDMASLSPEMAIQGSAKCATISQATLLHTVSFMICVHVTFMHMGTHTERICTLTIPVVMVPPTAPLPEVEQSIDTAYHKKHDKPPTRTVRQEDAEVPRYSEGGAGPSFTSAPPPFEEREAPPPFFPSEPEASSSRLPTFVESETEIYVPSAEDQPAEPPVQSDLVFEGEGSLFGFTASDQFDGYQEQDHPLTPPPSMEMATLDPDVTSLATMDQSAALNALGLALEQHQEASHSDGPPPPPPPPMDDPSDPPPSIDSDFRAPGSHHLPTSRPSHNTPASVQPEGAEHATATAPSPTSHGHAPPPYQVPDEQVSHHGTDNVAHPPPYVDLVPASSQGHNP